MQDAAPDESRTKGGSPAGQSPFRLPARTASAIGPCAVIAVVPRCWDTLRARVGHTRQALCMAFAKHGKVAWCRVPCPYLVGKVPDCLPGVCTALTGVGRHWHVGCVGMR